MSFTKILVANRGEIAWRIMRTAKAMGYRTVAVYSDADKEAPHVAFADESVRIGPPLVGESYLSIDRILEAAHTSGADAMHPGYGFLSENEDFATACENVGLIFIGPPPAAIAAMGNKAAAKRRMIDAGVPCVPGYQGADQSDANLEKEARKIGLPVMVKAAAGGGGRGMRLVERDGDLVEAIRTARAEAESAFGSGELILEKAVVDARHVEIQVFADNHGNVIHLGERDCSVQRRHQKVVEEAPSPAVNADLRARMGAAAVAAARTIGYRGAGTVEFLLAGDGAFYFLEMNTRLQVEHPVTELITGLDLVELMIKVAAGEKLPFQQKDVKLNGWAVEARVYAEDPFRNFLPSTGRLVKYREPVPGPDVRVDTGVYEGGEISMFYDPMIAKLCTHGKTRNAAIDRMRRALDEFYIRGVSHNVPFLAALMAHPRFRAGKLTTNFIAEEFKGGFTAAHLPPKDPAVLAAVAAVVERIRDERSGVTQDRRVVMLNRAPVALTVTGDEKVFGVDVAGREIAVETEWQPGEPLVHATVDGLRLVVQVDVVGSGWRLTHEGGQAEALVLTPRQAELYALMPVKAAPDTSKFLLSPMPGLLASVAVSEGQEVKAGEALAVVEAMKMENVLRAARDGTIKTLHAKAGDSLRVDQKIIEFA